MSRKVPAFGETFQCGTDTLHKTLKNRASPTLESAVAVSAASCGGNIVIYTVIYTVIHKEKPYLYKMVFEASQGLQLINLARQSLWSPDGTCLAFRNGYGHFTVMQADGSTHDDLDYNGYPRWSPDGCYLSFADYQDDRSDIEVVSLVRDVPGGEP